MTKAEETRQHNLFIKFKNEGKSLDEIGELLAVDKSILNVWNQHFENETQLLSTNESEINQSQIIGINEQGEYKHSVSLSLSLSPLQKVIFDLSRYARDNQTYLAENAKKYLPIFTDFFTDLNFSIDPSTQSIIKAEYTLKTNNTDVQRLANEALQFYSHLAKIDVSYQKTLLIQNTSEDQFQSPAHIMPFALKTLKVKNFDGIIATGFNSLPIDTQWIFLIGENGYGKTSLLRAITIALVGEEDNDRKLFKALFDRGIGIELFSLNQSVIHNVGSTFERFQHLACYGPSRLNVQTDQTKNEIDLKSTTTYSLFKSDGILLNIEYNLVIWSLKDSTRFETIKDLFKQLIPYLEDIKVTSDDKVYYIEKEPTAEGNIYTAVLFEQLASGFRSIIAMVGDMIIRLFKSQPEITNPSELAGIVIIDELDLHWHPKMQREIPQLLSQIFPKIQFIVSTHSLVPLLGAPENSVLLKVNRTKEEGITVEKIDIDFQALSSDKMLRDIFDLEKYMSDAKQQAWERYTRLKSLIHFEKDETKKLAYIEEREQLGDKYKFGV